MTDILNYFDLVGFIGVVVGVMFAGLIVILVTVAVVDKKTE